MERPGAAPHKYHQPVANSDLICMAVPGNACMVKRMARTGGFNPVLKNF